MKFTADELIAKIHAQIDSGAYDTKYSKETLKAFTSIFVQEVIIRYSKLFQRLKQALYRPKIQRISRPL